VTVLIHSGSSFSNFDSRFPLSIGCNLLHVVQSNGVLVLLCHELADVAWQCCPDKLYFEKLHRFVDKFVSPFGGGGCQVFSVGIVVDWSFHLVHVGSITFFNDHHGVGDYCQQFTCGFVGLLCKLPLKSGFEIGSCKLTSFPVFQPLQRASHWKNP
jgi:hypothetical protein